MIFVVVWLLYHFTLKSTLSVNGVWIITFVGHLHVWETKSKPLLMFFQLPILILNNVLWVNFFTVLFDETQHAVKTSATSYVPVCYEIVNLFIEPQNLLLIGLTFFLICKLRGLYLISTVCDGLFMIFLYFVYKLLSNQWNIMLRQCFLKIFALGCWLSKAKSYMLS